jgi:hypothetical protein
MHRRNLLRVVILTQMPVMHLLLDGAAIRKVQNKNSYSDLEITERTGRNEGWLSVLLVISIVAYLIVVPVLFSDLNNADEDILIVDPLQTTTTLSSTGKEIRSDPRIKQQETYSIGKIYCIIVGSYINPENARTAAEKFNRQGYQTNIITTTLADGRKAELVSVRIFNNYDDAASFLNEFRSNITPEAWIYSN